MSSEKTYKSTAKRKWGVLPILDFYVLKEFLVPFTVLLLGFTLLFIIGDIFNDLGDFLETKRWTIAILAKYFALKLPGNIRFILPIAMLLSCMYTMANFGRHMEVTAMRASGISLLRCGGSIYVVGLIVTGINFWFNEGFVPTCETKAEYLRDSVVSPDRVRETKMLTYRSPDKKRTWLFKYFNQDGIQKEVILKKYRYSNLSTDGEHKLEWHIEAKEAEFIAGKGWVFRDLTYIPYNKEGFMPGLPKKMDSTVFSVNEIPETPDDIMKAVSEPDELPIWDILAILNKTKDMAENCKDIYRTIFYYRLAFPWACFIAVFLGIPLAANNERGGIFKSIIIAVGVIIVYQLMSNIFMVLGKQGFLNPILAGLTPTVAFIMYGWHNINKHT